MAVSEGFSHSQQLRIDSAIRDAETASRLEFSVYVGSCADRSVAQRLHAALSAPAMSVLIAVDPTLRRIDVITGARARAKLPDERVDAAIGALGADVGSGELVDGIINAVHRLAEDAVADH